MIFSAERCTELVLQKIVTDKKGIRSRETAAHQAVAFLFSQFFKCRQTGAEKARKWLSQYQPPEMDKALDKALVEYIEQRKTEITAP